MGREASYVAKMETSEQRHLQLPPLSPVECIVVGDAGVHGILRSGTPLLHVPVASALVIDSCSEFFRTESDYGVGCVVDMPTSNVIQTRYLTRHGK